VEHDLEFLAIKWIEYYVASHEYGSNSSEAEKLLNFAMDVIEISLNRPDDTWHFILEVSKKTDIEFILFNLAAGPLETMLASYGEDVIDRVELEAKANPRIRYLLRSVWRQSISDKLWIRIQSAAGLSLVDGEWIETNNARPCETIDISELNFHELADAWIVLYSAQGKDSHRTDLSCDIEDILYRLSANHPEEALCVIMEISSRISSKWVQWMLGDGPLSDLVMLNGEKVIERIENEAKNEPKFKETLSQIRRHGLRKDVMQRIMLAAGWTWENGKWVRI